MNKVFIVTEWDRPSCTLRGVFSSEENAYSFINKFSNFNDFQISEYFIDCYDSQPVILN